MLRDDSRALGLLPLAAKAGLPVNDPIGNYPAMSFDQLTSDSERALHLQHLLIARATTMEKIDAKEYAQVRRYFMESPDFSPHLPAWLRSSFTPEQFWAHVKQWGTYKERRTVIWDGLRPLLDHIEGRARVPADPDIMEGLKKLSEQAVHDVWTKALERRSTDPAGAITIARTLLETVLKNILDADAVGYDSNKLDLHDLYKAVAGHLSLAPEQYSEPVFKQILGGCSAIVGGLGNLRNRHGDAHGAGAGAIRPATRHAELAVNLAGAMASFFVSTWAARNADPG